MGTLDSRALRNAKTDEEQANFEATLERIKAAREFEKNKPVDYVAPTKCPQCKKEKMEGEKCGCELVEVEKIIPTPVQLLCDTCGSPRISFFTKIQYPSDGLGVFTYLKGYKFPYPGWADQQLVDLNAVSKRALMSFIKKYPLTLFFNRNKFVYYWADIAWATWKPLGHPQQKFPPKERFCKSGREILRVGEYLIDKYLPKGENEKDGDDTKRFRYLNFLWSAIMTYEFDNAYRFRGQDILSELNKDNLKKNYRKEIIRLLKLGLEREKLTQADTGSGLDKKWKILLYFAYLSLYFMPKTSKLAKEFFEELNIDEVKPTEGDWYFMRERFDYNFGGIPFKERLFDKLKEDKEFFKDKPIEPDKPQVPVLEINSQVVFNDLFWEQDEEKSKSMLQNKIGQMTENLNRDFIAEIQRRKDEKAKNANKG